MSLVMTIAQSADQLAQTMSTVGAHADEAIRAVLHWPAEAREGFVVLAQGPGGIEDYAGRVQQIGRNQEEQLGWLATFGKHFIGVFQRGGQVFLSFVTGIIPTLIVLMTAFYAVTEMVGEKRVHGIARAAGRIALTRYTVLPVLAVFFLTNPMAYTFGTFLEEKHKPAFYDSAVSFVHPVLGLFPHANPGEYFVWGGVLVALLELERTGRVPAGYHVTIAIAYFLVGIVVILLKGILTEKITMLMARRQGVDL
jgi:PTS system glucitol/sorbitol-specific IIC component